MKQTPTRPLRLVTACLALLALWVTAGVPAQAQVPTRAQAERLIRENPELARQRILESGLSDQEIRARLTAAGLPANALDALMGGASTGGAELDPTAVDALEAIGLAVSSADGLSTVPVETGMGRGPGGEVIEEGLPIFGHGVFRRATSQFQPLLSGPVPDDYQVGPGDQMVLLLTGEVELAHDVVVTREGFIIVPDVGRVSVANLTMAEVRTLLRRRLATAYSGISRGTTSVNTTITGLRTNQIYVIGEVAQPGAYQLASVATLTNALYAADGPTALGNLRDVQVRRRDGTELRVDLYPYLLTGSAEGDVVLEQGDVVFVPLRERRVQLRGAVVRPAWYEVSEGEDLLEVLATSGGFEPGADRTRLTIYRVPRPADRGPGLADRVAIDLELRASTDPNEPRHLGGVIVPPIDLQDGDNVVVGSVRGLEDGAYVTIGGRVSDAGIFPWREGLTLRDLMLLARGPTVGADLRAAEIARLPADRRDGQITALIEVPMDSSYLSHRDADGRYVGAPGLQFAPSGTAPEFALQPYDRVVIRMQPEFSMPRAVSVAGEVAVPGSYALADRDERLTDLFARGGRVLPSAYLEGARFFREDQGRVSIDLLQALAQPDGPENFALLPGDSLHIPEFTPTVTVTGAVNSPVTVLYRASEDFDYYVASAGGYRSDADEDRISVRYADGRAEVVSGFLFWSSKPDPLPGSTIVVPATDPADRIDKQALIADLVGILGSLTTVIVVLTR